MSTITFKSKINVYPTKGKLIQEYKPLHNLRDDEGRLLDFTTDKLKFDLMHPVDIEVQPSYDGSVNLILNDDKNKPRLINSRFTVLENNQFEIMDHRGNNDTNIYDENQFEIETSLYKQSLTIPKVKFVGIGQHGNFKVGNYVFYFKYVDDDGNETDFVEESGIVSCYVGNIDDPYSMRGGTSDENSFKSVHFYLTNCDNNYDYIKVYYTRSTSSEFSNEQTTAYSVDKRWIVINGKCDMTITGFEPATSVTLDEINAVYNVVDKAKTQTQAGNRLFFANTSKPDINYKELSDLSLKIYPQTFSKNIGDTGPEYDNFGQEYYNIHNIYHYLGYWNHEIYRFGIVYILEDNTLSPVFNIRGWDGVNNSTIPTNLNVRINNQRTYLEVNQDTWEINGSTLKLENALGVCRLNHEYNTNETIGIKFTVSQDIIDELKNYVKGFFFVRQKRIPTILAQAMTIGFDSFSELPCISDTTGRFFIESFLNADGELNHDFTQHKCYLNNALPKAALCPDYVVNSPLLNNYFTSSDLRIKLSDIQPNITDNKLSEGYNNRYLFIDKYKTNSDPITQKIKIVGCNDDNSGNMIRNQVYRNRAGEPEEAWRFRYIGKEKDLTFNEKDSEQHDKNYAVRGSFGTYLGIYNFVGKPYQMIDIYISDYNEGSIPSYFQLRYDDASPFHAISQRYDLNSVSTTINVFRGDCFICNFTHRIHRNFQDLETPTNSTIIDSNTWKDNYRSENVDPDDKKDKDGNIIDINRSDVNAVGLGHWITFKVRSNYNLSLRCPDFSFPTEQAINGHPRGFYPLYDISTEASWNIPESNIINKGYNSTTSDKYNILRPNVPYIKNYYHTRISYSNISITDAFKNGYRTFKGQNYKDYPTTYGGITKIIEWFNSLIVVFEHAIAYIAINERVMTGSSNSGLIHINTANVLQETPTILSGTFGSQWADSVIKTENFIYGVDTVAKQIWRTNGQTFESISDLKIDRFLNRNITLGENELSPIIAIRNVKTHYNHYKKDVLFTFYDTVTTLEEKCWNLCFNEVANNWVTFYSWIPLFSDNIHNLYYSIDRMSVKPFALKWLSNPNEPISIVYRVGAEKLSSNKWQLSINDQTYDTSNITYVLERDPWGNYNHFNIDDDRCLNFHSSDSNCTECDAFQSNTSPLRLNISVYVDNNLLFQSPIAVNVANETLQLGIYKHGLAGLGLKDSPKPCHWYGKQHPFEFEFVAKNNPHVDQIWSNIIIFSNKVNPESFHYEIEGIGLDFKETVVNEYIRQEAWKDILQYNGKDVKYDRKFLDFEPTWEILYIDNNKTYYKRSTSFPLYYNWFQTFDEVYNSYQLKTDSPDYNYANLSGTTINHDGKRFTYNTHVIAKDLLTEGQLRGNMIYRKGMWMVQIPQMIYIQKNELSTDLVNGYPKLYTSILNVPVSKADNTTGNLTIASYSDIPNDIKELYNLTESNWQTLFNTTDDWNMSNKRYECKLRDKYVKVKVRYSGDKWVTITGVQTICNDNV